MLKHPQFTGLCLHSDAELAELLGADIIRRITIHEWPLSCVQRLELSDGGRLIYKSQLQPTVEPLFYERAVSKLLPQGRSLGRLGHCETMVIQFIDSPTLCDTPANAAELAAHGRRLIREIAGIKGDLPFRIDLGTIESWTATVDTTLNKLEGLIREGRFLLVAPQAIEQIQAWSASAKVLEAVLREPRLIHGDLKADQIFVTLDGYRIIDWQRQLIGPPEVDLVSLLIDQKVDPIPFVERAVIDVFWFLRLQWAVEAQADLFPKFRGNLFDQWSGEAVAQILNLA